MIQMRGEVSEQIRWVCRFDRGERRRPQSQGYAIYPVIDD